jgi:hypothetical protein
VILATLVKQDQAGGKLDRVASTGSPCERHASRPPASGAAAWDSFAFGLPDAANAALDHAMQEQVA